MPVVNELITEFSFEGSLSPLDDYNTGLDSSIGLLVGFTAAVIASSAAIGVWVSSITSGISPLLHLSTNTGISIEAIQELGFAASVSGSNIDAMNSSLTGLSQKLGDAAQFGSEDFARLGISIRDANGEVKKADKVLLEIGRRFQDLNFGIQERISFAQRLGIDASTVQLISKTGAEISKLRDRAQALGVVTKEEAEAAEKLNDINFELKTGFESLQRSIAVGIAPQMEELTRGFTEFLIANKEVISEGLQVTLEVVALLTESLIRLLPVLALVGAGLLVAKGFALGFAGVMAIIAAPVVLWTAAIVLGLAIIDDLIVAFQGGDSVIAEFFKSFLDVDLVKDFADPLLVKIKEIIDFIKSIPELIAIAFGELVDTIKKSTTGLFDGVIDSAPDWLVNLLDGNKTVKAVIEMQGGTGLPVIPGEQASAGQQEPTNFGGIPDWLVNLLERVGPSEMPMPQIGNAVGVSPNGNQDNSVNSLEQNNTFNITSDNPGLVATEIDGELQRQIENAKTQLSKGGR